MKPTTEVKERNDIVALTEEASDLTQRLESLTDGINLTAKDVRNFKTTVALLTLQKERLNEVLGILSQLARRNGTSRTLTNTTGVGRQIGA